MNLIAILSNIRFPDFLDILFISIVSYQLYIWFWGTKAFKALVGIVVLSGVYIIADSWGLFLTTWVFQILWQVFVILLIILFQREIRQMLERFNPLKNMGIKQDGASDDWIENFSHWVFESAKTRTGAAIIFERRDLVFDLITKGLSMEADPQAEILNSIFYKASPLHDGAILISNGKILKTSCYLPLTTREDLPQQYGTRHRAALGLTEQSDAWVLIISEERGEVSLARGTDIEKIDNAEMLTQVLKKELFRFKAPKNDVKKTLKSWVTTRYKIKLSVLAFVFIVWLVLAGQQNFEKRIELPLTVNNLSDQLVITQPLQPKLVVTVRGLRKDVSLLSRDNISTRLDLWSARSGTQRYSINAGNLILPNDRVHVVNISPSQVEFVLKSKGNIEPDPPVE
jgi:diadenylate cyclase